MNDKSLYAHIKKKRGKDNKYITILLVNFHALFTVA